MRTLLIDDFKDITADVTAKSFEAGINALTNDGPFDLLLLDHDLGSLIINQTGYDIMCWLEAHPQYLPKQIKLVTMNPSSRIRMQAVLDKLYPKN